MINFLYVSLSPDLINRFYLDTNQIFKKELNDKIDLSSLFQSRYDGYKLSFYVTLKKGTEELKIIGPSISKRYKTVDYSIFLPDEIKDLNHYIDLVFEGVGIVLAKYGVQINEVIAMRDDCKRELGV